MSWANTNNDTGIRCKFSSMSFEDTNPLIIPEP
jgi:hypothetical protein